MPNKYTWTPTSNSIRTIISNRINHTPEQNDTFSSVYNEEERIHRMYTRRDYNKQAIWTF